jgi:hypothetical protein
MSKVKVQSAKVRKNGELLFRTLSPQSPPLNGGESGIRKIVFILFVCAIIGLLSPHSHAMSLTDDEIAALQVQVNQMTLPNRVAFWAERFVGRPYDRDPLGEYVRRSVIIADERVDCMYHVFRSVELARAETPSQAVEMALDMRFHGKGLLEGGRVVNYADRYAYGEDMARSGKFGSEVSRLFGPMSRMHGSREITIVEYVSREAVLKAVEKFLSGDIIFFVRWPQKRILDEVIGHMGIVVTEEKRNGAREYFLVHAAGMKGKGGSVRKVPLRSYLATMPFAGIQLTRFE